MNPILERALEYLEDYGFSVFPANPAVKKEDGSKSPLIKEVIPLRSNKPSREQVIKWWEQWPNALIAGVCGEISNLLVLDIDSPEALAKIEELLPESFECPVIKSPNGKHYYFKYRPGLSNDSKNIIHVRTQGAYIILPGSVRTDGKKYEFINAIGGNGFKKELKDLPDNIYNYLLSFSLYKGGCGQKGGKLLENEVPLFGQDHKDEGLFHTALCLLKGGMLENEVEQVLESVMQSWGEGHLKKWRQDKIESVKKRLEQKERNITEEAREFVMSTTGQFMSTDVHKFLDLSTRVHKKAISMAMSRFWKIEGLIERDGNKNGCWRRIDKTIEEQCWWEHKGEPLKLRFPLGVEQFARVYSGNIILLEGQKSQGKSAFALEFCRLNRNLFKNKILYQNAEMSDDELTERFESYSHIMTPDEWREAVMIIRQTSEWWDKINPDGLNIVDYLIEYKEAYLVADYIFKIHQKLKSGIALIVVQRDPFKPYPTGGRGVRDIPRLILSLIKHKIKLEDVKSFHKTVHGNPTGLIRKYKQVNWWDFQPQGDWISGNDERYKDFKRSGDD